MKSKIYNTKAEEVGTIELNSEIFESKVKKHLVHAFVRWQRAAKRSGNHSTLTKAEVSGGGKKPWKQKGTGRARAGSNTSPLWVGGGVTFGPKPRDYSFDLNKKERRAALLGILSACAKSGSIMVVDKFDLDSAKTKDFAAVLKAFGLYGKKVAVILSPEEVKVERVMRNVKNVEVLNASGLNAITLLKNKSLLFSKAALAAVENRFMSAESGAN